MIQVPPFGQFTKICSKYILVPTLALKTLNSQIPSHKFFCLQPHSKSIAFSTYFFKSIYSCQCPTFKGNSLVRFVSFRQIVIKCSIFIHLYFLQNNFNIFLCIKPVTVYCLVGASHSYIIVKQLRDESNSIRFYHFCVGQFMQLYFYYSYSLSNLLLGILGYPGFGMPLNRKRKQRSQQRVNYSTVHVRCGGLVVSVPGTRSARPGFESQPRASPQSVLRGGRSLCKYCTNKL